MHVNQKSKILKMLLDDKVRIQVKSSKIIYKLKEIGIESKIGDIVDIEISKLWHGSNIRVNVKCDICGTKKAIQFNLYNKNIKKYKKYTCSNSCAYFKNKLSKLEKYGDENYINLEKIKKTKLIKYGIENYINVDKIKKTKKERYGDENYNNIEKAKKTNMKKYGVECSLLSNDVIDKIKRTNKDKYGNSDFRKSEYVKNKKRSTFLMKYGVESYMKSPEFREKSKKTNIEKYGFDSPNKSPIIKEKKIKSMILKYGYISNSITEESKKKLRETNLSKYGVEYPMQLLEFFEKQQKSSKKIIKYNDDIYYQGRYEKDFLDYTKTIGIIEKIKRGPIIKYKMEEFEKVYFPDFYYDDLNLIIEIKSSYYFKKYYDKNISKMNRCIELGYNFIFIINKDYSEFNKILKKQTQS